MVADLNRTDYAPYFDQWVSVLFYANPSGPKQQIYGHTGDVGSMPCYKHKTCGALVKLGSFDLGKYPPRICPGCKIDTQKEVEQREEEEFWLPST